MAIAPTPRLTRWVGCLALVATTVGCSVLPIGGDEANATPDTETETGTGTVDGDATQGSASTPEIVVREVDFQIRLQLNGLVTDVSNADGEEYAVDVQLTPMQVLRIQSSPFSGTATLETTFGLRSFRCLSVTVVDPAAVSAISASPEEAAATPTTVEAGSTRIARCQLPAGVETAPGIGATVRLASDAMPSVRVVPNVAVAYDEASDSYYLQVADSNGSVERVPMVPGPTDGVMRVVEDGPPVGARLVIPDLATESTPTTGS